MKQIFRITYITSYLILFTNWNLFGQKTIDYSGKIDSLIKTTNIRQFNGVILIAQNGKTLYSKAYGFANFEKKNIIEY